MKFSLCVGLSATGLLLGSSLAVQNNFRGGTEQCDAGSLIRVHEGTRKCVYTDSTGHKTIGVGFNLDQSGAKTAIEAVGANFEVFFFFFASVTQSRQILILSL